MAELPSGTVTFLFTDIEGSTKLERELREQYSDVLREHSRLLRDAFERYGGREVDTQGDSFFVVFPRARDATAAAIEVQRALGSHAWPDGCQVRVRIGMHTGEASLSDGRYVGLAVHRGARISAAGHGGQILLSGSTRDVVEDDLPADQRLVDLGEQQLKDLPRPERVFQLVVEGLPRDFPPLKTADEQELAQAAGAAVGRFRPVGRRHLLTAGTATLVVAGAVIAAVVLARGGSNAQAAEIAANSVGLIDAKSGKVHEQVNVERAPTSVAVSYDAVWVTNANDASVSRVDPVSGSLRQTIPVGSSPSGIALGGGDAWVANRDDGTVSRIDPATNVVVQTIGVGNGPTAVAWGLGSIWVTNAADQTLSRLDPVSGDVKKTIRTDAVGRGVAVGANSVWVTDEPTGKVARIDPRSGDVTDTVSVGNGPTGIAYGAGAVWVANSLDGTVSRIDPATGSVAATIPVGDGPAAVAVGNGAVWVSIEFGNRVVKIDPASQQPRIAASFPVGNRPKGLAVGKDGAWVAVQATGRGHRGGRLIVIADNLAAVDPAAPLFSQTAGGLVFDGLTAVRRTGGAEGTQLVPDLAVALPASTNGGKTYTFRLRPGIRYSNGQPVRPADFRRGLERMVASEAFQPGEWNLIGEATCTKRRCDLSRGVVTGRDTVTIRLTEPNPRLPLMLGGLSPVPPETPLRVVPGRSVPGTGPYMVESFVAGREVWFVRNPYFRVWSPAARPDGNPDEIVWRLGFKGNKALDTVAHGGGDVLLGGPRPEEAEKLKARYASQLHLVPQPATAFLFMNTRQRPFDDIRVRRAVNYAVDRAQVAGVRQPTCQLIPSTVPGYVPYCPYTADPDSSGIWKAPDLERAKQLVAASGTRGEKVVVWSVRDFGPEAVYMVSLLRRLGYRAQLRMFPDFGSYFGTLAKKHPQAGFAAFIEQQLPSDGLSALACTFNFNYADFCDRRIDRELRVLVREEGDHPAAAAKLAARIDRELVDQAPWVPLFTPRSADFVSRRVGNYQSNPYNGILLDQLWVR